MTARSAVAIVTPSYAPDFERCRLLVESLARCAPGLRHYLIVDRRDRGLFAVLEDERTRIIESETLLSPTFIRLPNKRSYWWNWRGPPVRGWIVQQMLKIAAADVISADTLVYVDSDVAFIRPFDAQALDVNGLSGLLDNDYAGGRIVEWTETAARLLGLERQSVPPRGHVGNMICWRREVVLAMCAHIEQATGQSWRQAIARQKSFSEYVLYGTFVRAVIGYAAAGQRPSGVPLIQPSWGTDLSSAEAVRGFFDNFDIRTIGVMAHSKDATDLVQMRIELERLWAANCPTRGRQEVVLTSSA